MARGDRQEVVRKREVRREALQAKVKALVTKVPRRGVVPLNPGFFAIENARYAAAEKRRAVPVKLKGDR